MELEQVIENMFSVQTYEKIVIVPSTPFDYRLKQGSETRRVS